MALTYDGITDRFRSTAWTAVTATPCTFHAFIRTTNTTVAGTVMIIQDDSVAAEHFRLRMDGSGQISARTRTQAGGPQTHTYVGGSMSNNVYASAGARFTSATSRQGFLDGATSAADTGSSIPSGIDSLQISGEDGTANLWTDDIGEEAVWNRTLSAEEHTALANGFSALFFRQGLVFYHPGFNPSETTDYYGLSMSPGTPAKTDHPPIIYPSDMPMYPALSGAGPAPEPGPPLRAIRRRRVVVGFSR